MAKRRSKRQQAIIRRRIFICSALAVILALLVGIFCLVGNIIKVLNKEDISGIGTSSKDNPSSSQTTTEPYVVSSAKVVNTGDILVHSTVLDGAKTGSGEYDFSAFFGSVSSYFKESDLAVINLEVALGGTAAKYSGYPVFNTPDSLADVMKSAGINLVLTSNNHCYDMGLSGLKRTASVLKSKNLDFIGTKEKESDPSYLVKNVNGIKIGITNFTYSTMSSSGVLSINGRNVASEGNSLINTFCYNNLNTFYSQAEQMIADMKKDGAEAIVFYMHWGNEYQLKQNTYQDTISQKLCNLGVDIIVGGHPHVIQPMKLLHSEDSQNTSVCIYSTGNAISNQRQELMDSCPSGHTEDGVLFYYTFDKYNNGDVVLSGVDVIPTWVNKYKGGSGYQYTMYPLETANSGAALGLDATASKKAAASYERTKAILAAGLTECQTALGCDVRFK